MPARTVISASLGGLGPPGVLMPASPAAGTRLPTAAPPGRSCRGSIHPGGTRRDSPSVTERAGRQLAAPQPADGERAAIQATRGTLRGGMADSGQRSQPPPRHPRCAGSTRESPAPGDAVRQHTPSRNPAEPGPDHASRMPSHARQRRHRTRACAPRRTAVCAPSRSPGPMTLCAQARPSVRSQIADSAQPTAAPTARGAACRSAKRLLCG